MSIECGDDGSFKISIDEVSETKQSQLILGLLSKFNVSFSFSGNIMHILDISKRGTISNQENTVTLLNGGYLMTYNRKILEILVS